VCPACCRSCDEAEAEKTMLQRMVQAALGQQDAALGQQATLQELLVCAERRAATAGPGSHGIDSVKLGTSHIKVGTKVSRKC